jgi:hypothetical protein
MICFNRQTVLVFVSATIIGVMTWGCGSSSGGGGGAPDDTKSADTANPPDDNGTPTDTVTQTDTGTETNPPADTHTPPDDVPIVEQSCKTGDGTCPGGSYCKAAGCANGLAGVCTFPPMMCRDGLNPVCACDGNTYDSPCVATLAQQNVEKMGSCESTGLGCIVGLLGMCPQNMFCKGKCGGNGVCAPVATNCDDVDDPVCGCDGYPYPNPCVANSSSVNVKNKGECITEEGAPCGGLTNMPCGVGQACNITTCQDNTAGQCTVIGDPCPNSPVPECGCDGVSYETACSRMDAGISKYHDGPCLPDGSLPVCNPTNKAACGDLFCDPASDAPCAELYYCHGVLTKCEEDGVCKAKPVECDPPPEGASPFCACDGNNYYTFCEVKQADAVPLHPGPCE